MKKLTVLSMVVIVMATLLFGAIPVAATGNGAPSGAHFNLNIIGVQHDKDVTNSGGGVIFVPLNTTGRTSTTGIANKVDIMLTSGDSFAVLDNNATDDNKATFQMPVDVATSYTVWVRGLGKPTGSSDLQLWAQDPVTGEWLVSGGVVTITGHSVNGGAKQKFVNVTSDLFFLSDGTAVFDPMYQGYLWTYGNNGQKLVQLRFYPIG